MNESRLTDMEMAMAFQEKTIQDLSDVVCRQQGELDHLDVQIKTLTARLDDDASPEIDKLEPMEETPPHY